MNPLRAEEPPATAPEEEPLVTDRPDFTESTTTVPAGRFQLESGYTFTYDSEKRVRQREHAFPEFLMRIGVVRDFELRVEWTGYSITSTNYRERNDAGRIVGREEWSEGAHDVGAGFKLKFFEEDGLRPDFSMIGSVTAPSGSKNESAGDVEPEIVLLWSHSLTDRVGLAGEVLFTTPHGDGGYFLQTAASVSLGVELADRIGAYFEYYGFYPNDENRDCAHTLDGGLTFLVTNDFQIDVRSGFGLNEEADDFFTGIGFAWRF